ncbi:MAG: hypothetical protein ABWJ42_05430 [Sulfolobales archaeon]
MSALSRSIIPRGLSGAIALILVIFTWLYIMISYATVGGVSLKSGQIIYGQGPGVEIIIPSPSELKIPHGKIVSIQVFIKSPDEKIEVYKGGETSSIYINLREYWSKFLGKWIDRRSMDVNFTRIPIEINIWIRTPDKRIHMILAVAHIDLKRLVELKPTEIIRVIPENAVEIGSFEEAIETQMKISETNVKARESIGTAGQGPYCDYVIYEWRYNGTLIDTERDLGGWIPVLIISNPYPMSGTIYITDFKITLQYQIYNSFAIALGYAVGGVSISVSEWDIVRWDISYYNRVIKIPNVIILPPNNGVIFYISGKAQVNRYDLWRKYANPSTHCVEIQEWTGRVKIQTDLYYINFDSSGVAISRVDYHTSDYLESIISSIYNNLTLIHYETLYPPNAIPVHDRLSNVFSSRCYTSDVEIGFPLGIIASRFASSLAPVLALIPLSFTVKLASTSASFDWIFYLSNLGAYRGGYNVAEIVMIYATNSSYKISSCSINLPLLVIRSV